MISIVEVMPSLLFQSLILNHKSGHHKLKTKKIPPFSLLCQDLKGLLVVKTSSGSIIWFFGNKCNLFFRSSLEINSFGKISLEAEKKSIYGPGKKPDVLKRKVGIENFTS